MPWHLFWGIILLLRCVPLAQLDRVSDSDSEGRAFESRMARQKKSPENTVFSGLFVFWSRGLLKYYPGCRTCSRPFPHILDLAQMQFMKMQLFV